MLGRQQIDVLEAREAAELARTLNDKTLRFKAEFLLLQHASDSGKQEVARSIHRRLRKLANWIPDSTPELREFRELVSHVISHDNI